MLNNSEFWTELDMQGTIHITLMMIMTCKFSTNVKCAKICHHI